MASECLQEFWLKLTMLALLVGCVSLVCAARACQDDLSRLAQVVASDECDPVTFNAAVGPDSCKNVTRLY